MGQHSSDSGEAAMNTRWRLQAVTEGSSEEVVLKLGLE